MAKKSQKSRVSNCCKKTCFDIYTKKEKTKKRETIENLGFLGFFGQSWVFWSISGFAQPKLIGGIENKIFLPKNIMRGIIRQKVPNAAFMEINNG